MRNRTMKRTSLLSLLLVAALLSSSCVVGPNYERPKVNAPTEYREAPAAAQPASFADLPWWEVFQDETLKGLVRTALANNYDLRIAVTRIEQARQLSAQARAQYYPTVDYSAGGGGGRNEYLGNGTNNFDRTQWSWQAAASAAWEIDLWGRIRRLNEASQAYYFATEEARRGVLLSLVSDVGQAYFELLGLQLQLDIARRTTDSFNDTLKLFTQRLEGGVASKLDTSRAAAARASAAASIPELERQIALKENQICVLLGQNPGPIQTSARLLDQTFPPEIPAGLPSALLERRPDVREAEERVRYANARVGLAQAAFFPRVGLTALFGQQSKPVDLLSTGSITVWSLAGNVAGPLYRGGELKAQKRQAIAAWEEAKLQYEQTALLAFQDVANALVSRQKYEAVRVEQMKAVEAYDEAVKVSLKRYIAGFASYYEVLEAQQQLFPAENSLAQTELNRRVVVIQLYKALGGGWNLQDPTWSEAAPPTGAPAPPPETKK